MDLSKIGQEIIEGLEWVGEEAMAFGQALCKIIGIAGPAGLKVATDIAADVAAGGVTPVQATAQLADVAAFGEAIKAAHAAVHGIDPQAEATAHLGG